MILAADTPQKTPELRAAPPAVKQYIGEVVYIYAFDVAYDMDHFPQERLMGQPVAQFVVDSSKRSPRQLFMHRPQMVRLPPWERIGPAGPMRMSRTIKLLPVGAVSITVRVPFQVSRIEDLVSFHDLQFCNGSLHDEVRALAEEVRRELAPHCIRPASNVSEEEAYTVFCLQSPLLLEDGTTMRSEMWLKANRREIAALLTQEPDIDHLSKQESDESTGRFLSYYEHDLIVVDWDAALILDEPRNFDEILYVMELANLQLAELEAYDRLLDDALDRAYRDLSVRRLRWRPAVLRELREIRIDLARFNDELSNITKFFGDWHLARIYETIASRFHLGDWHRSIENKLRTLDNMYQLLHHDHTNRLMLILEATIVLLFIVDLVVLVLGM